MVFENTRLMRNPFFMMLLCLPALLTACNNTDENAAGKPQSAQPVYMNYKIWGEEGMEWVTCLFQFHQGSEDGTPLRIEAPASVTLDGEVLPPDSARLTGVFYELQVPLQDFTGRHTIVYKNVNGREFREEFQFQPLVLINNLSTRVRRGNLVLELAGLLPGEQVRVSLMDTAFATADINQLFTPKDNRIVLSQEQLQKVASGPVTLFLYKEAEHSLKNATPAGGRLSLSYELRREFDLVD